MIVALVGLVGLLLDFFSCGKLFSEDCILQNRLGLLGDCTFEIRLGNVSELVDKLHRLVTVY